MNDEEIGQRCERLEANLAHLEHQVEQMNEVIVRQDKVLEHLKKQVHRQTQALETMELDRIKANQTKPPHYQ